MSTSKLNYLNIFFFALFLTSCSSPKSSDQAPEVAGSGTDKFLSYAWHLNNTGQKVFAATAGTTGKDIQFSAANAALYKGNGIKVLVSDDGLESAHPDLAANFLSGVSKNFHTSYPYTSSTAEPAYSSDNHGTCVAGLIGAAGDNGIGSKGVAPKANLSIANFLSAGISQTLDQMIAQAQGDFHIFNQSWGATQTEFYVLDEDYEAQLASGTSTGRAGKGSIYVKSAGNDFFVEAPASSKDISVGNSNLDGNNTVPYVVVVAALNADGESASYSSAGSNVWVSAPGGEFGDDSPAMITTDRSGCSSGYSKSSADSDLLFEKGGSENSWCNYTVTFNGTSSAAPVLSGAIAVLLEANPNLTWRDVKHILASTSTQTTLPTTINHPLRSYGNGYAVPTGYVWEQGWVTNSAGYKFQNWYGFGNLNLDAAIALAKNYTVNLGTLRQTKSSDNAWYYTSGTVSVSIPDNNATGSTATLEIKHNFVIEAVQLKINVTTANAGHLAIELTSPDNTKSILLNMNNSLDGQANLSDAILLSNAFYGESSEGTWTLRVLDGTAGSSATLTSWSLNFIGHVDPNAADQTAPSAPTGLSHNTTHGSLTQSPPFTFTGSVSGDVLRHEYSIGTSAGATNVKEWTPLSTNSGGQATGLSLSNSTNYYINVRAIDSSENISTVISSSTPWQVP